MTANEVEVNTVLYATLVNEVLAGGVVPGFTSDLFCVSPTPGLRAYDGVMLEKRPDLFIHAIPRRATKYPDIDGLFVECKPVDDDHAVGQHYCDLGLRRFIDGQYAWAMREGMMVGYAKAGYDLPGELTRFLLIGTRPTTIPLTSGPTLIAPATLCAQALHITTHTRTFNYQHSGASAPPIAIHHLWLIRP